MHKWLFGNPAKIAKLWQFGYNILNRYGPMSALPPRADMGRCELHGY
jgi:hypothetical protein